ncbi:MAG: 4Fe-4S binding protein [Desulfovibrionaceae bacterium]|nr:4Fe-4S binding protein [Desulfovibrionaceae bacterium]
MSHLAHRSGYAELVDRLNRFPQGAAPTKTLYSILKILFSEREAELVALLPIKPFTAAHAAENWKMPLAEAQKVLDTLAGRALLVDIEQDGEMTYCLPPPMAGFFEFAMMRTRGDIDQHLLAQLYYQYMNVEEDFVRDLFVGGETPFVRTFVHEPALPPEGMVSILDHERATEVIRTAKSRGISRCYCRHKMEHMGRACDAPQDICMTFNTSAASLIRHGYAREVDEAECLDLLHQAWDHNLVQCGENARENINFICNCCGCCCEAMIAARRFGMLHPVETSNFLPVVDESKCTGCGKCAAVCPVEAMGIVSANDPHRAGRRKARLEASICLGCGLCVKNCPAGALRLEQRERRVITPRDSTHRAVVMAIERGKLQNLIFDNRVMWSHRAMAAVLGVILRLPPLRQVLALKQVKSRYLERLLDKMKV